MPVGGRGWFWGGRARVGVLWKVDQEGVLVWCELIGCDDSAYVLRGYVSRYLAVVGVRRGEEAGYEDHKPQDHIRDRKTEVGVAVVVTMTMTTMVVVMWMMWLRHTKD